MRLAAAGPSFGQSARPCQGGVSPLLVPCTLLHHRPYDTVTHPVCNESAHTDGPPERTGVSETRHKRQRACGMVKFTHLPLPEGGGPGEGAGPAGWVKGVTACRTHWGDLPAVPLPVVRASRCRGPLLPAERRSRTAPPDDTDTPWRPPTPQTKPAKRLDHEGKAARR